MVGFVLCVLKQSSCESMGDRKRSKSVGESNTVQAREVLIVHLVIASLLYGFDWKYQNGILPENVDMSESFGVTLHKAEPLCAVPIKKHV